MAKKKTEAVPEVGSELKKRIAAAGLTGFVRMAEEMPDLRVQSLPTGFYRLDRLISPWNPGLYRGCDVEVYSKKPSDGKTTLTLQVLANWQKKFGLKSAILDLERTHTEPYLNMLGIAMKDVVVDGHPIYAPLFVRPDKEVIPVEKVLDTVAFLSDPAGGDVDIIVVDSVGVMNTQKNLEKASVGDPSQYGGIGGVLTDFMKKNIAKKPTIFWLNQAKRQMSSMPGVVSYKTVGGEAIKFWSSLRIELARVKSYNPDESFFGFDTKVLVPKNKMGRDNVSIQMTYIPGEGFSAVMDYLQVARELGIVTKSGAWQYFKDLKWQGEQALYTAFKNDSGLFEGLKEEVEASSMPFSVTDEPDGEEPAGVEDPAAA